MRVGSQHVPLWLCSLLAAISQFWVSIGQKIQLTVYENAKNMRNAKCAGTQSSMASQIKYYTRCLSVRDFHSDHELHSWFFAISCMLRLLTTWRTLASDSRPGQACVRFGQDDCTMYTHCLRCMVWIALTNKMAETCVSYASARVSMSKICNRYLAKVEIWYNI